MSEASPRNTIAGDREAGTLCTKCGSQIALADKTSSCRVCGSIHHAACWEAQQGCAAYACSRQVKLRHADSSPIIKISDDELAAAQPLPTHNVFSPDSDHSTSVSRWNRTAIAAFVIALLGIPLFGLVTGLVAIVIGCIALATHAHGRRGMALAVVAIVLGMFDVVGWSIALSQYMGSTHAMMAFDTLTLDPESLDTLPQHIARAMRANVIIQSGMGIHHGTMGSGVILQIKDNKATIVTNRHTVDTDYAATPSQATNVAEVRSSIQVITIGQVPVPARLEWLAPHGVDLAILSAPVFAEDIQEAYWDTDASPHIGDEVFAIGNPHGLGWTHSAGDISQIRRRVLNGYRFRLLQTTAAINPGNSGGGLYDASGRLIGINTMTGDKRLAEGLGFSIALPTLLELAPDHFQLPDRNPHIAD